MKILTRVAYLSLVCSLFPLSISYANDDVPVDVASDEGETIEDVVSDAVAEETEADLEGDLDDEEEGALTLDEAQDVIDALPTAKDAVKGLVKQNASKRYYDIYGRQLAFRESAKDLRESLDQRRESFEVPHVEALERFRDSSEKVYAAETSAYQDVKEDAMDVEEDVIPYDEDVPEMADSEDVSGDDLAEQPIPSDDSDPKAPKKKVVTSGDAPDFDPANL